MTLQTSDNIEIENIEIDVAQKILVVDDKSENLIAMQALLKNIEADIDYVETGNEALSLMLRNDYALALVDVQMPEMDGLELVKLMRLNPSTILIPVIFVTATNTDSENIHSGYEAGAVDYMCKPFDGTSLLSKINFFLDIFKEKKRLIGQLNNFKGYKEVVLGNEYYQAPTKYIDIKQKQIAKVSTTSKILIVDDREDNIFSLKQVLSKLAVEIDSASSGHEAFEKAAHTEYAVILLDVQMPGINGFETAELIKSNGKFKDVPIIFITAINKEDAHVFTGYEHGAVDYIFKPFVPEILLSKIYVFLRLYEQKHMLQKILDEKDNLVNEVKEKNEKLGFLSFHDTLTILPNRKGFLKAIEKTFIAAKKHNRKFAVIQVDIDHFQSINNTYGNHIGDLVLQEVANRLKASIRKYDYIARMGGDEFAIILDDIESIHAVGILAQKLIDRFNESFEIDGHEIRIGLTAGIACYFSHHEDLNIPDAHAIIQNADSAMYKAKQEGRGTYQYHMKEFTDKHRERLKLEHALRFALDKNELFLNYQPKFYLKTRRIVGAEALVRWNHRELGNVPPGVFIPLAEDTQMIIPIGQWITENACIQLSKWLKQGYSGAKMSINLSPIQLMSKNFEPHLYGVIKDLNLSPKHLEFELTETAIMKDNTEILEKLNKLHDFGLVISIDDFGTGYSMLSYLKKLPVSALKIDLEFIQNVDKSRADAMIVKSIIDLANNFSLEIIAEGVETQAHVNFLLEYGCHIGQGYYYSKPIDADKYTQLLEKQQ